MPRKNRNPALRLRITLEGIKPSIWRTVIFVYDFGDNWIHRIEVEDDDVSADPGWIPWLLDGERRGPPEDCGGVSGYQRLIEAVKAPPESLGEEGRDFLRWAGEDFDPEEFSVSQARQATELSWGATRFR
jgi:hypothetical protein